MRRREVGQRKGYTDPEVGRIMQTYTKDRGEVSYDLAVEQEALGREALEAFVREAGGRELGVRARPWEGERSRGARVMTCNVVLEGDGPYVRLARAAAGRFYSEGATRAVQEHYGIRVEGIWRLTVKLYPTLERLRGALGDGPYSLSVPQHAVRVGFFLPVGMPNEELCLQSPESFLAGERGAYFPAVKPGAAGTCRVAVFPPSLMQGHAITASTRFPSQHGVQHANGGYVAAFTLTYAPPEAVQIPVLYSCVFSGQAEAAAAFAWGGRDARDSQAAAMGVALREGRLVRVPRARAGEGAIPAEEEAEENAERAAPPAAAAPSAGAPAAVVLAED